ncbi:MAG: type IV pilin protein [Gammaproteobacteria bacterium]
MIKRSKGMTLIELMITVAVVGILATIAYPSYQNQVRRSNRADAITALTAMANAQERFYLANNTYANTTAPLGFPAPLPPPAPQGNSQRGFYTLAVATPDDFTTRFTVTATAVAGGPQAGDDPPGIDDCRVLSLTSTGQKGPLPAAQNCW